MNSVQTGSPPINPDDRVTRALLWLAGLIPLLAGLGHAFLAAPMVSRDTSVGLQIWQNMRHGGGWNELSLPDPANIAGSCTHFVTWWSPGQYIPAGLLMQLGLTPGSAVLVVSLLSAWSLTAGIWKLSRALGAAPRAAAWAALAAAASWHTLYSFGMFIGGEAALLAVWPWIALVVSQLRGHPWRQLTVLPLLFLVGSFAKLSFGLYAVGLLAFLWLEEIRPGGLSPGRILQVSARLAVILLVYAGLLYWLFLQRDPSPVSGSAENHTPFLTIAGFALNGPWLAATGGGSFLGRLFMQGGLTPEAGWLKLSPALLVTGLAALYFYSRAMVSPRSLFRLAGVVSLVAALLLMILWLRGANISLEDRHLRPAGVLLLAAGAQFAGPVQPSWHRHTARTVLLLTVLFGLGATMQRVVNIRRHGIRLASGISLTGLDPAVLARLRLIDSDPATGLVYLPQPELALIMQQARVLPTDAVIHDIAWLAADTRAGRVSGLHLVLPSLFALDGRAAAIRASFTGYAEHEWRHTRISDWDFWQAPLPAGPRTP